MNRNERRKIRRLAARYSVSWEAAAAAYYKNDRDTAKAREYIRIQLIFNLIEKEGQIC